MAVCNLNNHLHDYMARLCSAGATGSLTVKVVPLSNSEATEILPPDASTTRFTIESPSPVPGMELTFSARKKGSNICAVSLGDIPVPLSET